MLCHAIMVPLCGGYSRRSAIRPERVAWEKASLLAWSGSEMRREGYAVGNTAGP